MAAPDVDAEGALKGSGPVKPWTFGFGRGTQRWGESSEGKHDGGPQTGAPRDYCGILPQSATVRGSVTCSGAGAEGASRERFCLLIPAARLVM